MSDISAGAEVNSGKDREGVVYLLSATEVYRICKMRTCYSLEENFFSYLW